MKYLDPHVHLRDFEEERKETVQHGLEVARDSGVIAIFDMPNTRPAIITEVRVKQRLALAQQANVPEVWYGLYVGLTPDAEQVRKAVGIAHKYGQVVGLKLYAGRSTNDLTVARPEDQERIYGILAQEGFSKVLAVHAESEAHMHHDLWDPRDPRTHALARPEMAEYLSVQEQIDFAGRQGFKGKLHIAHISSPVAVEKVKAAKEQGLDISCGVCPHHLVFDMSRLRGTGGLLYKMNPPLRRSGSRNKLMRQLLQGDIDWIETDHAPHTLDDKVDPNRETPHCSGVVGLHRWPLFHRILQAKDFSTTHLEKIMFENARARFCLDDIGEDNHAIKDRSRDYPTDIYGEFERRFVE